MRRFITSFAFALACAALVAQRAGDDEDGDQELRRTAPGGDLHRMCAGGYASKDVRARQSGAGDQDHHDRDPDLEHDDSEHELHPGPGGESVTVQEHIGQKVEVTGTLVPAAIRRTETTTRTEREDAPARARTRVETKNAMPEFQVTSIKNIGSC